MTQNSSRLGLPFIDAGQVDKSTTHNEALALVDLAVAPAVSGLLVNTPPPAPSAGDCYIVGASPTGFWAGHPLALAGFTDGGWRFVAPTPGLAATDKTSGETIVFRGGNWEVGLVRGASFSVAGNQILGPRLAAVSDPSGGTIVDSEARAAITAVLDRLRQHGLIAT